MTKEASIPHPSDCSDPVRVAPVALVAPASLRLYLYSVNPPPLPPLALKDRARLFHRPIRFAQSLIGEKGNAAFRWPFFYARPPSLT